jgi:hypothetical protein
MLKLWRHWLIMADGANHRGRVNIQACLRANIKTIKKEVKIHA